MNKNEFYLDSQLENDTTDGKGAWHHIYVSRSRKNGNQSYMLTSINGGEKSVIRIKVLLHVNLSI